MGHYPKTRTSQKEKHAARSNHSVDHVSCDQITLLGEKIELEIDLLAHNVVFTALRISSSHSIDQTSRIR